MASPFAAANGPPITGYQLGAELLNFGASIAFMGVDASAFARYFIRAERRTLGNLLPPLLGFATCFYTWLSLRTPAKVVGLVWLATGLLYGAWKTNWFTRKIEFSVPDKSGRQSQRTTNRGQTAVHLKTGQSQPDTGNRRRLWDSPRFTRHASRFTLHVSPSPSADSNHESSEILS